MHRRAAGVGTGTSRGSPGLGFGEQPQELWEPSLGPSSPLPGLGSILGRNHGINWEFIPRGWGEFILWGQNSPHGDKIHPVGTKFTPLVTEFISWGQNSPCGVEIHPVGMEFTPLGTEFTL